MLCSNLFCKQYLTFMIPVSFHQNNPTGFVAAKAQVWSYYFMVYFAPKSFLLWVDLSITIHTNWLFQFNSQPWINHLFKDMIVRLDKIVVSGLNCWLSPYFCPIFPPILHLFLFINFLQYPVRIHLILSHMMRFRRALINSLSDCHMLDFFINSLILMTYTTWKMM